MENPEIQEELESLTLAVRFEFSDRDFDNFYKRMLKVVEYIERLEKLNADLGNKLEACESELANRPNL